jgi:glyoxylase-like metal-dependent hydrolase (beta-lactamase superfamily II)
MQALRIGDVTITSIVERDGPWRRPEDMFPGYNPEVGRRHLAEMDPILFDQASGKMVITYQTFIVRTPRHTILVDTCTGEDKGYPPPFDFPKQPWLDGFRAAGLRFEDIDYVFCTHLHIDHCGWNTRLVDGRWVPTFPKARYLFSKKEYEYWTSGQQTMMPLDPIKESVLPVVEANRAELVTSDHELNDHIRLTPTPGHTPDHFAVCAGRGGDQAVFTGDLIHSPIQARYPELVMRVDTDRDQAIATRRQFFERYCDTDTLCCTMHFPSPSVGHVRRWGGGFRLEYVTD